MDVSSPSAPVEVGFQGVSGDAYDVAVTGGYAYVAASSGLRVVNVSNPAAPVEVGSYDIPDAVNVAVANNYIYVAGSNDGLYIMRFGGQ